MYIYILYNNFYYITNIYTTLYTRKENLYTSLQLKFQKIAKLLAKSPCS